MDENTRKKKMTGNPFLDKQKPGDTYTDSTGAECEVLEVYGPQISEEALKRLRRVAFRLTAKRELG